MLNQVACGNPSKNCKRRPNSASTKSALLNHAYLGNIIREKSSKGFSPLQITLLLAGT